MNFAIMFQFMLATAASGMVMGVPSLKFEHYPVQDNRNCKGESTLDLMFTGPTLPTEIDDNTTSTCCTFQDTIVTENPVESDIGLNEFSVAYGQLLWSHDVAITPTSQDRLELTCKDGRKHNMGALKKNGDQFVNEVTACMDGSFLYGSKRNALANLTQDAFPEMKMNRTNGGTCDGKTCNVQLNNPFKADKSTLFAFGDVRGNENVLLSALHIMWAKRHNQWIQYYSKKACSAEKVFKMARARVIAEVQQTSKEYVETLVGSVPKYDASKVQNGKRVKLFAEFSHGLNRVQHAQLRNDVIARTKDGTIITASLFESFFNATVITKYGYSALVDGSLSRKSLNIELQFVPELLGNVEQPNSPNLALLDCSRGREIGFASYNSIRKQLFNDKIKSFYDITQDDATISKLRAIYGNDVGQLDLYIAGLAEQHLPNSAVGKTFKSIFFRQFEEIMYHDDGWFEHPNYVHKLFKHEIEQVKSTTMADIILQSSDIDCVPAKAFFVQGYDNPLVCTPSWTLDC